LKTELGLSRCGDTAVYTKGPGEEKPQVAEKAKGGLESELGNTREPETPLSGEIVRNPKEGSAQNRFVRVTKPGSDAQELRLEGKAGTLQGGSETW